jgi:hypothetical protein
VSGSPVPECAPKGQIISYVDNGGWHVANLHAYLELELLLLRKIKGDLVTMLKSVGI